MARSSNQKLSSVRSEFNQGSQGVPSDVSALKKQYEDFSIKMERDIKSKQRELLDSYQKRMDSDGLKVEGEYEKLSNFAKGLPVNREEMDKSIFRDYPYSTAKKLIDGGELYLTDDNAIKLLKMNDEQKEEFERLKENFLQEKKSYINEYYTDQGGFQTRAAPFYAVDPQSVFSVLKEMTEDFKDASDPNNFLAGYASPEAVGNYNLNEITYLSKDMFDYGTKHGETAGKIGREAVDLKDDIKLDFAVIKGLRKDFQKAVDNNDSIASQTEIWKEYISTYKGAIEKTKKLVDYATENQSLYQRLYKYDNTRREDR